MSNTYNGVNAVTTAMGDTGASFNVTLENQSSFTKVEPLTNLQLPAGQTVLVNVTGELAHAQLVKNIQQINAMAGFEVIGVSSVAVGGGDNSSQIDVTNGTYVNGVLTYTGGTLETPVGTIKAVAYHQANTTNHAVGELEIILPTLPQDCNAILALGDYPSFIEAFSAKIGETYAGFYFEANTNSSGATSSAVSVDNGDGNSFNNGDTQYFRYFINNGTLTCQTYNKADNSLAETQVIGTTTATLANLNVSMLGESLQAGTTFNFKWLAGVAIPQD